jgi:MFS family permease
LNLQRGRHRLAERIAKLGPIYIDVMSPEKEAVIPRSLYWAMIVQFAIGGAVLPFVSILLRDRGLEFSQISRIFFASSSTLLFFPFLWGLLADRFIPMNRLFVLLNLVAFVALAVFAIQKTFWGLLVSFTVFVACFQPTLTLINALSFHHLRSPREQFATLRAWGSVGWIIPSLPIYIWLARSKTPELDFALYLGIGLSLIMAVIAMFLPHTPASARTIGVDLSKALGYWPAVKRLVRDPNYITILASFFLMAASSSILIYYSPPFLEDLGIKRSWLGPIQCIGVVLEVVLFPWLPGFIARWRYAASILLGCACLLGRHLLFAYSDNPWLLSASYLLAGMVIVFYNIGLSILVNAIASLEVRATAQTLLVFFGSGMGPMFANWAAGLLAPHSGDSLRPVFLFAAALAGLATLLILLRSTKLNEISHTTG